ncbi:hypothetical protein FRB97_009800 [Tulasnella sp. 331]|nr:hypothetical protein FRB97_009800 [Tulasnella sp. 331]KAG8872152.1 hypothetical protein FRB98_000255 [Tulasnella sp. 332]
MGSGSMFPNLTEVVWQTSDPSTLPYITLFLVPSVVSLEINCNGRNRLAHACIEALELLTLRQISLSFLELRMSSHDQTFLYKLSTVLASQTRLVQVGLPPYSATRQVVRALGRLPSLEEYFATFFDENQSVMDFGKEFDWELDTFPVLKRVTLYTSLTDATSLMARPHQPRLNRFTLSSRETFLENNVYDFCSTFSRNQSSITRLNLLIYPVSQSELTTGSPMSFSLFSPLLQCRGLKELRLESHLVLAYDGQDIGRMASAWPDMSTLSLCPDPDFHVDLDSGQPLRTVSVFTRNFAYLRELGLYINTLDIDTPPDALHAELAVLDLGTSIAPDDGSMSSVSEYLAKMIEPLGNLKAGRSVSHIRFLLLDITDEYNTRVARWETIAANIGKIHESGKDQVRDRNLLGK